MKVLAVSDKVVDWIYSPRIRQVITGAELVFSCGDLPLEYLEFIVSTLDIPVYYVQGNHSLPGSNPDSVEKDPHGSINLNGKVISIKGFTFAGVEGSLKYNNGLYQYSQFEMWLNVFSLIPSLLTNKVKYGRYLDIFITHAPPWGIHDQPDLPHQGIKAFRWLAEHFQPTYLVHGHIHVYRPDEETETVFGRTRVINSYGYKVINLPDK